MRQIPVAFLYKARNDTLVRMGFPTYSDYLASDLWKSIRKRVLERDLGRCIACRNPANQCHHARYGLAELDGSDITHIHAVCRRCHENAERDGPNHRGLHEANRLLGVGNGPAPFRRIAAETPVAIRVVGGHNKTQRARLGYCVCCLKNRHKENEKSRRCRKCLGKKKRPQRPQPTESTPPESRRNKPAIIPPRSGQPDWPTFYGKTWLGNPRKQ